MALSDTGSVLQAIGAVGGGERPCVSMAADTPEHVAAKILEAVESAAAEVYADTFGLQPEATERGGGKRNGEGSYVPRSSAAGKLGRLASAGVWPVWPTRQYSSSKHHPPKNEGSSIARLPSKRYAPASSHGPPR